MRNFVVTKGQHIKKGQILGYVGSTGRSTASHLHYEVRLNGVAVNPVRYMREEVALK
ncbi:MAG: Murein DD-endopeptidase MepM [Candidatus Aerophobetes bacterium ADurb.Bin490]|nr:MAG: Murein DD-endopeptidase MepM [Candidatus Aerophobetes bacterium ADurb.Bin490]